MYKCEFIDHTLKRTEVITDNPEGVFFSLLQHMLRNEGTHMVVGPRPKGVYSLTRI